MERRCGNCVACCHTHGIPPINKPPFQPCPNVGPQGGCSVYQTRPQPCRDFSCFWLMGAGTDDMRPDKLGLVLSQTVPGAKVEGVVAYEVKPGASEQPAARELLARFSESMVVYIIRADGNRVAIGPVDQLGKLQRLMRHKLPMVG